ncbi:MAG: DNA-directed RNA polymerase subunit alpha [bacterium]|nr:DNA-directed RNA polymerase subunit alpha [bacterium]
MGKAALQRNWEELIKPTRVEVEASSRSRTYGRFFVEPLERGFGTTLGNSLRRVLLSSLQGAAITEIKFDGILHEFSTLPGVFEDLTDIGLNLKQVRFKILDDTVKKTITLNVSGEREVLAGDFQTDQGLEILNPDLHIANLNPEGKLRAEAVVRGGKGYVPAERLKDSSAPVGTIFLDAIFGPVLKVNYSVTNARVGQITDYDRLVMEIWTNGGIEPEEAIALAAKILKEQLQVFISFEETEERPVEAGLKEPALSASSIQEILERSIEELELSVRATNCLKGANINTIRDLVSRSESEMLKMKNFGRKSLNEVMEILQTWGLSLKPDEGKEAGEETESGE